MIFNQPLARRVFVILVAVVAAGQAALVSGTTLVYEGFDYQLVNNATMNGVSANATGLTGNYTVTDGSTLFRSAGLSFSGSFFPTTGGALFQSRTGTTQATTASVLLNAGTQTGTLYQSYLFRVDTANTTASLTSNGLRLQAGPGSISGTLATLSTAPDALNSVSDLRRPGVAYSNANAAVFSSNALPLLTGTTYLGIAKFTNVGSTPSAGSPGVATFWVLSQSNYDNWLNLGAANEANLSTYAGWTATQSLTSGSAVFSTARYQHFFNFANDTATSALTYDELRWGTTLDSVAVVVVPEPAGLVLAGLGIAAAWAVRCRKARVCVGR